MRCHICNAVISDPQWNKDHADWDPCVACQQAVMDVLAGYKDTPFIPDEQGVAQDNYKEVE